MVVLTLVVVVVLGAAAGGAGLHGGDVGAPLCYMFCTADQSKGKAADQAAICKLASRGLARGEIISPLCQTVCSGGWEMQCLTSCC